ncbi:MAPEG family protein [Phenylobacterium sp.]|uniref:MAPEG family protein n=1 Tax=Phenylobacterium sp. TaxID=1871053 RepID=UPI0025F69BC0|nr:MAPEG family protein [Phenylobacterium sp.]MBX3482305.1 MAPEG family protein [Phenylobacterium sp.]
MDVAIELKLLAAAVVVGLVQLLWAAGAARAQQDMKWAAGPRDTPMPITGVAARLERAFWNFAETFPFFAVAVLAAAVAGKLGQPLTVWGAWAYVVGRALYVPLYATGVPLVRTIVWFVAMAGMLAVLAALFR